MLPSLFCAALEPGDRLNDRTPFLFRLGERGWMCMDTPVPVHVVCDDVVVVLESQRVEKAVMAGNAASKTLSQESPAVEMKIPLCFLT